MFTNIRLTLFFRRFWVGSDLLRSSLTLLFRFWHRVGLKKEPLITKTLFIVANGI